MKRSYSPKIEERKEIYVELLKNVKINARGCTNASICTKLWYLFVDHYPTSNDFKQKNEHIDSAHQMSEEMFKKFPEFKKAYDKYYIPHGYSLLTDKTRPLALKMAIKLCENKNLTK